MSDTEHAMMAHWAMWEKVNSDAASAYALHRDAIRAAFSDSAEQCLAYEPPASDALTFRRKYRLRLDGQVESVVFMNDVEVDSWLELERQADGRA